jgi:hypothetical protein
MPNPSNVGRMSMRLCPGYRIFLGVGGVQKFVARFLDNIIRNSLVLCARLWAWLNEHCRHDIRPSYRC